MNLPQGPRGRLLAAGLLLIPLLVILQYLVIPGWNSYAGLRESIEDNREQLQRYRRIAADLPALRQQLQRVNREQPLAPFLLAGRNRALASASLQRHLQELVRTQGGRILSLRALRYESEGELERIPLEVRFQVDIPGLQQIIYELESGQLHTVIEQLNITMRRTRAARQASDLDVRLTLSSLRAAGEEAPDRG